MVYYLVARNSRTNDFKLVPIDGKTDNSLEKIDLFTTEYSSLEELSQRFGLNNYDDFYIVNRKKYKGVIYLNRQEVLLSDSKEIQSIAKEKDITKCTKLIDSILDRFCNRMATNNNFFDMVIYGDTNIYKKFIDCFSLGRHTKKYDSKYKSGNWARKSYPLVRNILDSFSKVKDYQVNDSERILKNKYRDLLNDELLEVTDKEYNPNQGSLFDILGEDLFSLDNKIIEIMETFDNLEDNTFIHKDGKVIINSDFMNDSLLDSKFIMEMEIYNNRLLYKKELEDNGMDTTDIDKLIKKSKTRFIYLFNGNRKLLDNVYEWCLKYSNRNKALGDINGDGYQKRKN